MLFFKYSVNPFLLSLFWLLSLASEAAPIYSAHYCAGGTVFKPNSTIQSNRNVLLSSLTSKASLPNGFYRTTTAQDTPDAVTGLFLCRGDVDPIVCQECIAAAAKDIIRRCPNQTELIILYDVCMMRYSNGILDDIVPGFNLKDDKDIASNLDLFDHLLANLLNGLTAKAASSLSEKKFAIDEVNFTSSQTLYGLAQCVTDLSSDTCDACFKSAIGSLLSCCDGRQAARILLPGCEVPFYSITATSAEPLVPPPSSSGDVLSQ